MFFILILLFLFPVDVYADVPNIDSPSAVLIEQSTGRVLYSQNERERRPPAQMTKMLAALVVLEYLGPDEEITVGPEIRNMPAGSGANIHTEGEVITVRTLLNSLLVRSSNEAGRVLALNTIRRRENRRNVSYDEAETTFSVLMNETARSIGAMGTHFTNPFGAHSENHFTTAYDMAFITRAFIENPLLAEIAGTLEFEDWTNTNLLLPGASYGYPYMTGAKTGFNAAAGYTLAGTADNGELRLISVVMGGTEAERWQDTRRLMDYGFLNFGFYEIAFENELIETVFIENPCLGDDDTLELILNAGHTALLSRAEFSRVTRAVIYDPLLYVETDEETVLRAPIESGATVGHVVYSLDGNVLFEAPLSAARAVEERTFDSDMDYYLAAFFANVFTRGALPYWFGVFGTGFGIFGIFLAIKANRRAGKAIGWAYERHRKSKYSRYK